MSLSTHHSETSLGIRHSVASLSTRHTGASLSTRHTTVSLGTRHIDVRRRSSGLGRLPSQSCDEGRTKAPNLERVRRPYFFGDEETLGRSVFVHSSVMSKFTLVRIHRLVVLVVRRPPRERKVPGSNPACAGIFSGSSRTSDLNIGTPVANPAPGYIGSALGLVGPVSVSCDWVR